MYKGNARAIATTVAALIVLVLSGNQEARATPGEIHHLNTLGHGPGDQESYGYGVNPSGQVVGFVILQHQFHAFRFDGTPGAGGAMVDLGTLGGSQAVSFGINVTGQVVGYAEDKDENNRAFLYVGTPGNGGVMHDLGTLGGAQSSGSAINSAGQIAGEADLNSDISHAFRYDGTPGNGGVMHDLGTFGPYTHSVGRGINDLGQVAGAAFGTLIGAHAFRYDGTPKIDGVMRDLGTLGGDISDASDVNNAGQVTGIAQTGGFPFNDFHAFRYDGTPGNGGVMHDLGTLGGPGSHGNAINNASFVVGLAHLGGNGGSAAALWRPDLSVVNLDAWLDTVNPALGALWLLKEGFDITDSGLITGWGEYNDGPGGLIDGQQPFLLDASSFIPEPAWLGLIGALALIIRRKR